MPGEPRPAKPRFHRLLFDRKQGGELDRSRAGGNLRTDRTRRSDNFMGDNFVAGKISFDLHFLQSVRFFSSSVSYSASIHG